MSIWVVVLGIGYVWIICVKCDGCFWVGMNIGFEVNGRWCVVLNYDGVVIVVNWCKCDVVDGEIVIGVVYVLVDDVDLGVGCYFWVLGSGKLWLVVFGEFWWKDIFDLVVVDGELKLCYFEGIGIF